MTNVLIVPQNIELDVIAEDTILSVGLAHNLNLPHGCKNGKCGACKCKVVSGNIQLDDYNNNVLTEEEISQGYTLLCKAHPLGNVVLDIPHILNGFPIKVLPAKVETVEKINTTAIIVLKLPAVQSFGFYAGQYIDILMHNKNRSYSIANSPTNNGIVEIHVRYHKGGIFSEFVWDKLQPQQLLKFKGPLGTFQLSQKKLPMVMVCTGTGFAPIKAILEYMSVEHIDREVYLYWGNRHVSDFYLLDWLYHLQVKLQFKLTLCLSNDAKDGYTSGYVTQALSNDFTAITANEVYACGNLNMIEDVYLLTTNKMGLGKENFFSDAFTPST